MNCLSCIISLFLAIHATAYSRDTMANLQNKQRNPKTYPRDLLINLLNKKRNSPLEYVARQGITVINLCLTFFFHQHFKIKLWINVDIFL